MFIVGATQAATGCKQIDSVQTSILSVDKDLKGNSAGKIIKGDTSERWVATACGKTASFLVIYTPDGQGGSFIAVRATNWVLTGIGLIAIGYGIYLAMALQRLAG